MANQGNLFSASDDPATALQTPSQQQQQRQIPRWLVVMEVVLFTLVRLLVGTVVAFLPWLSVWTNPWMAHWPTIGNFIAQGWVRGIVSGLGLLNIWIAFSVLFRRRRGY